MEKPGKEFISERLGNYPGKITEDRKEISADRKAVLAEVASYINEQLARGKALKFTFICTHNSRRSHFAHIWAQTAAWYYDIPLLCYSGGTEATAFNINAVKAMRRAGFEIISKEAGPNPAYDVRFSQHADHINAFSKKYSDPFNPQEDYVAIMTCAHADENCPVVFGADARFSINYEDPKDFDNTAQEEEMYDLRCRQIASEMFYMLALVNA